MLKLVPGSMLKAEIRGSLEEELDLGAFSVDGILNERVDVHGF